MLTGENPGASVIVPPTLITQSFLNDENIRNMEDLGSKMPQFQHADVAMADWMPLPTR
jgi:simple sugar transport system substrate-binding protein